MKWNSIKKWFRPGRGGRDIYVEDTNLNHWKQFEKLLHSNKYKISLTRDGSPVSVPNDIISTFKKTDAAYNLTIYLNSCRIYCSFFWETEIELHFDPRELKSEYEFNELIKFMKELGDRVEKDVSITYENSKEAPIIKYIHETNTVLPMVEL